MNNCPFCAIVSGEKPSWIVYRSDSVICFLPRKGEAYGHTIIAPVIHIEDIYHFDPDMFKNLTLVCK